jgi:pyruvate dehydrogenase E2 component (dihydrolipoyllysine-residue acetyltransferase)
MTEGTIAAWRAVDGETVSAGQVLYVLETEKVELEIEAPTSGTLRIVVRQGERCPVGTQVATIEHD